jgi:hypothetical protein
MSKDDTLSRSDRNFLKDAAADGIYEVEAAKIASEPLRIRPSRLLPRSSSRNTAKPTPS